MGKERQTIGVAPPLSVVAFIVLFLLSPYSWAQVAAGPPFPTRAIGSIAAIGDSIIKAFDAQYTDFASCRYTDNPEYSFSTNTAGNTTVSIAERAIAYKGSGVATANFGSDGAKMSDGLEQAQAAKAWAVTQAAPRLITVFLGHNDICRGEAERYHLSCPRASQDPNNYCRTSPFYYEQQMRQMLDVLVTIPDSQVALIHPIRVSQLCNFAREKVSDSIGLTVRCQDLWETANLFGGNGVCPSLTSCSADRVADAYTTWVAYREIGNRIVEEYNLYGAGQTIPQNPTYNTGNIVRASGVLLQASDVIGSSRFNYRDASGNVQLSVCECYHPSKYGQNLLTSLLWEGVSCSSTTPCCNDHVVGDSDYNKGLCNNYTTGGSMSGLWYRTTAADYFGTVQQLYIGYYQRPADPEGLLFWANGIAMYDTNQNGTIDQNEDIKWAVDQFATSLESQKIYGGNITSANIAMVIDGIYMGLFNRHAESDGLTFWANSLNTWASTPGTIVWEISRGAQGPDYDCLMNKVTASNRFVHALDPDLDGQSPFFAPFPAWSNDWLADITSNAATIPTEADITDFLTGIPYATLTVTPYDGLSSSGTHGGPFTPSSNDYILTNTGTTSITWTASKLQPWISLSATGGTLAAGASTPVTVSINSSADSLAAGSYNDVVAFTNTTTGSGHGRRPAILTVK
jgi:lysophospholipase L1-like esterase